MSDLMRDPEHEAVADAPASDGAPARPGKASEEPPAGITFWVGMAFGALIVAVGLRGLFASDVRWIRSAGAWFVAGGVVVDLAVVPVIGLVGLAGQRLLPRWAWRVVRAALLSTAVLLAFSWVLVVEPGRLSSNPTVRPRNYGQGLLVYLVVVWVVAAIGLVASWFLDRREVAVL